VTSGIVFSVAGLWRFPVKSMGGEQLEHAELMGRGLVGDRAYDGQQSLEMMREHKPDLVLLDIAMPVLEGMGLLEHMLVDPNLKDIPVVLLTASSYSKEQTSDP
jgi:CheY-like chemotaxis protein